MVSTPELLQPPVWLLFGLSGSGKSHVGELIHRTTRWPVYHADDDITPAMRQALAQAKPFTDAMRDEYFAQLAEQIARRRQAGEPLLVTQGVYKQRHRQWLTEQVPGLIPIWVQAPPELINARLAARKDGVAVASAAALANDFEVPPVGTLHIHNDGGDQHILDQFRACHIAAQGFAPF